MAKTDWTMVDEVKPSDMNAIGEEINDLSDQVGDLPTELETIKQEAISAAATDATTKANAAETNAKNYVDTNFRKPSDLKQANLVKNSSFLQGTDYWQTNNVRTWGAYSNTYVGFFVTADSSTTIPLNEYATLKSEPIGVSQTYYRLSALLHTAGSLADSRVYIEVVNNANNNIIGSLFADNQTWWHRKTTTILIPAGVSSVSLRLVVNNFPALGTAGFSRISLTEGTQDFPYSQEMDIRALYEQNELVKQSGVDAKNGVVGAINAKGGSASTNDTWGTLADKINAIQTGPKYASGVATSTSDAQRISISWENRGSVVMNYFVVNNLTFRPNRIIVRDPSFRAAAFVYTTKSRNGAGGYNLFGVTSYYSNRDESVLVYELAGQNTTQSAYVNDTGFLLPCLTGALTSGIEWEAFGV